MVWDQQDDKNSKPGPWGSKKPASGDKKDNPWQGGNRGGKQNDAPDLDDLLQQAQNMFGKSGGDGRKTFGLLFFIVIALWLATGFYRVLPEENAVILTFGKWTATRAEPGLGYHIPWPVQSVGKVNVAFDRRVEIGFRDTPPSRLAGRAGSEKNAIPTESRMLTGDENIVDIDFVIMWRISDARNYLFEIRNPEFTIKKVAESAMREIIGREHIQRVLTEGRADIAARARDLMQKILDEYKSGITINSVQLLRADPPGPVVDAFDDVQRARADRERAKNEAETYRNDIVPRARGDAQKILQDAEAYKAAVTDKATGEAARFDSVYKAYAADKDVTRKRIYIDTMQEIMQNSKKMITTDGKGTAIVPYFPLEQMQGRKQPRPAPQPAEKPAAQ